jgi:hypothetical protein
MPKARFLPWSRVAVVCRRIARQKHLPLPERLDGEVRGEPFERDEARLTALAEFMEQAFPEKRSKTQQKGAGDATHSDD